MASRSGSAPDRRVSAEPTNKADPKQTKPQTTTPNNNNPLLQQPRLGKRERRASLRWSLFLGGRQPARPSTGSPRRQGGLHLAAVYNNDALLLQPGLANGWFLTVRKKRGKSAWGGARFVGGLMMGDPVQRECHPTWPTTTLTSPPQPTTQLRRPPGWRAPRTRTGASLPLYLPVGRRAAARRRHAGRDPRRPGGAAGPPPRPHRPPPPQARRPGGGGGS